MCDDIVERVARALKDYEANILLETGSVNPTGREYFEGQARAAIAAMREPTEAMMEVGVGDWHDPKWQNLLRRNVREIWKAMINAALGKKAADAR